MPIYKEFPPRMVSIYETHSAITARPPHTQVGRFFFFLINYKNYKNLKENISALLLNQETRYNMIGTLVFIVNKNLE
jgi:hypothetical protein